MAIKTAKIFFRKKIFLFRRKISAILKIYKLNSMRTKIATLTHTDLGHCGFEIKLFKYITFAISKVNELKIK